MSGPLRVALLGNPNTGKTTLFNRLCGLRHKTSNFPGTTQEARVGFLKVEEDAVEIVDLPGIYSLELEQSESEICRRVLAGDLAPPGHQAAAPDVLCVVVDSCAMHRNLLLVGEALRRRLPVVVVLNMADLARKRGLKIDYALLRERLGCEVIPASARKGDGLGQLTLALRAARVPNVTPPGTQDGLEAWTDTVVAGLVKADPAGRHIDITDTLDRAFTHPVVGLMCFAIVMVGLFWSIFSLAKLPMDLISGLFGKLGDLVTDAMPEGVLREFVAHGVVTGVGSTLVFLPQICLLFFLISLLEDTGYLARGAFVINRWLRPFGLSGHAFVPLLSSHACALPGIMACRGIPDRRERLAAILVAPFMSCSARIPVYVLLTGILFRESALKQAMAFVGCYALGIVAALASAIVARRTLLRGPQRPMAMELPGYKRPSLRTAFLTTYDRGLVFLKNAGTNILAICIVLWWLQAFPRSEAPAQAVELRAQASAMVGTPATTGGTPVPPAAGELIEQAKRLEHTDALRNSFAGRMGRAIQPVFAPLGYDWQLTVGVITSFAAREVFVSTMAVMVTGSEEHEDEGVLKRIGDATRDDGETPIFTRAASWSLLVYYVLAMQCLPTLAVTAREAGGVKWAFIQLGWMSGMAYVCGALVYFIAGGGA
ncbi:MAG: ferrous iron transporter B [Phycisphaerales bacterium]|jgi:ferrous iron transport protein B